MDEVTQWAIRVMATMPSYWCGVCGRILAANEGLCPACAPTSNKDK